jgi:Zeta toxin
MRTGVPDRPTANWSDGADSRGPDAPRRGDGRADDLARRLESLPDGHPSSPYEADGTPRETPGRRDLNSDLDPDDHPQPDEPRPYTDPEWADHKSEVPPRLETAREDGLSTLKQHGLDDDGDAWTLSRSEVHRSIINDMYKSAGHVPCDRQAIIAGGLAGAGKTTVLRDHAGIDRSQYFFVNPDDVKVEMAKRGLIPKVEGLSPMEASDLVHEESSYIARQLAQRAQADGKNMVWDITMSSLESTEKRINDLRADGYTSITGIFVDIPIDVSVTRADSRHRDGEDKYRAGEGLGGRFVPPDLITSRADEHWGSQNRRTFEDLKPRFDQWILFDNGVDHRDPVRIAESLRNRDNPQEAAR